MATKTTTKRKINYGKEVVKLFSNFFTRDYAKKIRRTYPSIMEQPKSLRKAALRLAFYEILLSIIGYVLGYAVFAANIAFKANLPIIGILAFILSMAERPIYGFMKGNLMLIKEDFSLTKIDAIIEIAMPILNKVNGNVYQEKNGIFQKVSNEGIQKTIKCFIESCWDSYNCFISDIVGLISIVLMLFINTKINSIIPSWIFIALATICFLVEFSENIKLNFSEKRYDNINRKHIIDSEKIQNDILRTKPIVPEKDLKAQLFRFQEISTSKSENNKKRRKKFFSVGMKVEIIKFISKMIIVLLYFYFQTTFSWELLAQVNASVLIFEAMVQNFSNFISALCVRTRTKGEIENLEADFENILETYKKKSSNKIDTINELSILPFSITYNELSENDKPFTLEMLYPLSLKKGDIVALSGASGTGKTTFLKLATSQICVEKNSLQIPNIHYMYYDDSMDFSPSGFLFDEIFCLSPKNKKYDIDKMSYILKGLNLYSEISNNCHDIWQWLKENTCGSLSRGQKQRLIIAKILYWLDENIDIIALDECTSGLDENSNDDDAADAKKVINFIIDYCNQDKKRILLLSTHQKEVANLCNRSILFQKKNGKTTIISK